MISEIPNDSAPMKSFRDVRSQSQISSETRLAKSSPVSVLEYKDRVS